MGKGVVFDAVDEKVSYNQGNEYSGVNQIIRNEKKIHIDGENLVEGGIKHHSVIGFNMPLSGQFTVEDVGDDGNDEEG